ncbi:hypothetical protein [Nocardiopsis dassonvillei]|nr:hypothetical protein [Nocardiopsis dassonvillei]
MRELAAPGRARPRAGRWVPLSCVARVWDRRLEAIRKLAEED